MTASDIAKTLQTLLDAGRGGWIPRDDEAWADFVRRKAPPRPGVFHPIDRARYDEAVTTALSRGQKSEPRRTTFLPMWLASNDDEEARDDEWQRRLFAWSDGEALAEVACPDDFDAWARADVVHHTGAYVTLARHYAPSVGVDRFGPYAVVNGRGRIVIETVDAFASAPAIAKPTKSVPAFSTMIEPAIDLKDAPEGVATAAEQLVQAMTNLVGDDE